MAKPIKIALLGPSGVGRFHAREFLAAGADIHAVLASTPARSAEAAKALGAETGHPVEACATIYDVANTEVNAATICLPPRLHVRAIEAFLGRKRYVFCEKPLFWRNGLSPETADEICDGLRSIAAGRLCLNTNNVYLLREYLARYPGGGDVSSFGFRFFTHGSFRGADIGVDLLAHALSLLLEVCAEGSITGLVTEVSENRFLCKFQYGGIDCSFDLREGPDLVRGLAFRLNEVTVERIQQESGGKFRVFLAPQGEGLQKFAVTDPFRASIAAFLDTVERRGRFDDDFAKTRRAMVLMVEILQAAPSSN